MEHIFRLVTISLNRDIVYALANKTRVLFCYWFVYYYRTSYSKCWKARVFDKCVGIMGMASEQYDAIYYLHVNI